MMLLLWLTFINVLHWSHQDEFSDNGKFYPVNEKLSNESMNFKQSSFETTHYYPPGQGETFSSPSYFMQPGVEIKYRIQADYGDNIELKCIVNLPCAINAKIRITTSSQVYGPYCGSDTFSVVSTTELGMEVYSGGLTYTYTGYQCQVQAIDSRICKCGQKIRARIVGGKPADEKEFPWDLALYKRPEMENKCGATVISHWFALTASHCTYSTLTDNIYLYGGSIHLGDSMGFYFNVISKIEHPQYNPRTQENDVALLKTAIPMRFTPYLSPICLPNAYREVSFVGVTATYSGWGSLSEGGEFPKDLQKVNVKVVTNEDCLKEMKRYIFSTSLCTYEKGKDACQGDSGGLLSFIDKEQIAYQIGIVSFGDGCARPNRYGVNARVTSYIDWIHFHTGICFRL